MVLLCIWNSTKSETSISGEFFFYAIFCLKSLSTPLDSIELKEFGKQHPATSHVIWFLVFAFSNWHHNWFYDRLRYLHRKWFILFIGFFGYWHRCKEERVHTWKSSKHKASFSWIVSLLNLISSFLASIWIVCEVIDFVILNV